MSYMVSYCSNQDYEGMRSVDMSIRFVNDRMQKRFTDNKDAVIHRDERFENKHMLTFNHATE